MSRLNIPLEALTSRLNLGSRFEGVRSQSIGTRFANLKPVSEFFDFKRLSKPAGFGEVQSRINYNLAYFSSNYFAVAAMLAIYSLLTNLKLLFDMIFMGAGLFAIKKLDGRDLDLGFTRLTSSQLYTVLFVIGIPVFIWASPISTALWLVGAIGVRGGLGGRPRTPKDSPLWGRPSGAQPRKRRGDSGRQHTQQWERDPRVEEIDSDDDDDDGQGVGLGGAFVSDDLHFTGVDLGTRSRRREVYDNSESEEDNESDDQDGGTMQLALRDKEEVLVEKAWQRIRRAQQLGKPSVKLSQPELAALERERRKRDQDKRPSTGSDGRSNDRRRSSGQSSSKSKDATSLRRKSKSHLPAYSDESSSSSRRATPPGMLVLDATGVPAYAPLGYYPPPQQDRSTSRPTSRSTSSHNTAPQPSQSLPRSTQKRYSSATDPPQPPPSRRLPDDPNWIPRPRSSSSISSQHQQQVYPYDSYQYQTYSPPLPQIPAQYAQTRRIVSNPQARVRGEVQGQPSLLRREYSGQEEVEESSEEEGDSGDEGVQVDVVSYGRGYDIRTGSESSSARDRPRRGPR